MHTKEHLEKLAAEWQAHCTRVSYSSNPYAYLHHPAVDQLVGLGAAAVPLIMQRYTTDELPWEAILVRITGVNFQDDPAVIDPAAVQRRRLQWWAQQSSR